MSEAAEITQVLQAIGRSEEGSAEKLLPLVYAELRRLAAARMAQEMAGQTLQPTALVHEAWLRLVKDGDRTWQNGHISSAPPLRPCAAFSSKGHATGPVSSMAGVSRG
jgi:hypothetical protein